MSEIKKLNTIIKGQKAKIDNIEERMKDIFEEYTELIDVITALVSDHYANEDTPGVVERAENILEKLRKKYGLKITDSGASHQVRQRVHA